MYDKNVWANFVEKAVAFHRTVKLGPEVAAVTSDSMGVYRSLDKYGKLAWGLRYGLADDCCPLCVSRVCVCLRLWS